MMDRKQSAVFGLRFLSQDMPLDRQLRGGKRAEKISPEIRNDALAKISSVLVGGNYEKTAERYKQASFGSERACIGRSLNLPPKS